MSSHAAWVAFFDEQEARLQEFRSAHAFDEVQEKILGLLAKSHRLSARSWRSTSTDADMGHTENESLGTMSGSEDTVLDSVPWQKRARPQLSTGPPAQISHTSHSLSSATTTKMYHEYSVERLNDVSPHAIEKMVAKPLKVFRKTPIAPRAPPVSNEGKTSSSERPCAAARHSPDGDLNNRCESKAPWQDIMRQQRLLYNKKAGESTQCQVGAVGHS